MFEFNFSLKSRVFLQISADICDEAELMSCYDNLADAVSSVANKPVSDIWYSSKFVQRLTGVGR